MATHLDQAVRIQLHSQVYSVHYVQLFASRKQKPTDRYIRLTTVEIRSSVRAFPPRPTTTAMDPQVVVICVIIGAGVGVLFAYATTRYFFDGRAETNIETHGNDFSQTSYMRDVRIRNTEQIAAMNGHGRRAMVSKAMY